MYIIYLRLETPSGLKEDNCLKGKLFSVSLAYTCGLVLLLLGLVGYLVGFPAGQLNSPAWFAAVVTMRIFLMALVVMTVFLITAGQAPGGIFFPNPRTFVMKLMLGTFYMLVVNFWCDMMSDSFHMVAWPGGPTMFGEFAKTFGTASAVFALFLVLPAAWAPKFVRYDGLGYISGVRPNYHG